MAGGKGSRLGYIEKPLIKINNYFLIDLVIKSLKNSKYVEDIFIATSKYTEKTKYYIKDNYPFIKIIETPGNGYIEDLNYCFKYFKEPFLVVSSDIIFSSKIIDEIIANFKNSKYEALSVYMPESIYVGSTKPYNGLVPAGINIISPKLGYQKEKIFITDELIVNINTKEDLEFAKKFLLNIKSHHDQL